LVTGATSGLGRWLVRRLAGEGATVLVHGRDPAKVEQTVAEAGPGAAGFVADLADLAQVRRLGQQVAERGDLSVLVNNAGIGSGPPGSGRELSPDGYELRWAVDYLAPVALTRALLPTLLKNAPARIVNVGSLGQLPIDFDDLQMAVDYNGRVAYQRAKLAMAAWSFELADELREQDVAVNCVHPATFMDTGMVRESEITPTSTVDDGGEAVLRLIDEPGTGDFYDGKRRARAHPDAYDATVRARLRAATDAALGA
jgi:NAD(P)-dependent dehydrogenase (short-subunit alcohol dehydrogenase family)